MKNKTMLALCVAAPAVLGAGIAFYRNSLIEKCTDPMTGRLLMDSAGAFTPFFIVAALCALLCFVLTFPVRGVPRLCGVRTATIGFKTVRVIAAFLLFTAAVLLLVNAESLSVLTVLKSIFLLACGGSCIAFLKAKSIQDKGMCSLFPLFFMSIYLLSFYRDSARNPLTYTFAFEIVIVIALLLALYLSSSPWFNKNRPGPLLLCTMLSTFGAVAVLSGVLLNRPFFKLYLPIGFADSILICALLLLLWGDIFDSTRPLPPQPAEAELEPLSDDITFQYKDDGTTDNPEE